MLSLQLLRLPRVIEPLPPFRRRSKAIPCIFSFVIRVPRYYNVPVIVNTPVKCDYDHRCVENGAKYRGTVDAMHLSFVIAVSKGFSSDVCVWPTSALRRWGLMQWATAHLDESTP